MIIEKDNKEIKIIKKHTHNYKISLYYSFDRAIYDLYTAIEENANLGKRSYPVIHSNAKHIYNGIDFVGFKELFSSSLRVDYSKKELLVGSSD